MWFSAFVNKLRFYALLELTQTLWCSVFSGSQVSIAIFPEAIKSCRGFLCLFLTWLYWWDCTWWTMALCGLRLNNFWLPSHLVFWRRHATNGSQHRSDWVFWFLYSELYYYFYPLIELIVMISGLPQFDSRSFV